MARDIFDNKILCKECNSQMKKYELSKNGFKMRVMVCPKCNEKLTHPADKEEYNKFINLKNKDFQVKMRMVGNSYAVSIPKEIVHFMNEQKRKMDEMVNLCFEDVGRLSLNFNAHELEKNPNARVIKVNSGKIFINSSSGKRQIKAREVKILKDGKFVHARQYLDSAHPEKNKTIIKKGKLRREI